MQHQRILLYARTDSIIPLQHLRFFRFGLMLMSRLFGKRKFIERKIQFVAIGELYRCMNSGEG